MRNHTRTIILLTLLAVLCLALGCKRSRRNGMYPIFDPNSKKWGYIDKKGTVVINPQFEEARYFSEGLAAVRSGGKSGFISPKGDFVINPQFDTAYSFSEGLAAVVMDHKLGFIDTSGKIVINPQFDTDRELSILSFFSDGLALVKSGQKFGFIDKTGKYVINPQFGFAAPFSEGLALATNSERPGSDASFGFIDKTGKFIINPQFKVAFPFTQGLAAIQVGELWGFADKTGKYAINPQYKAVIPFSADGLAGIQAADGKWGAVDKAGKLVINPQFEGNFLSRGPGGPNLFGGRDFIEGYLMAIDPRLDDLMRLGFSEGLASVSLTRKQGYIDTTGKYTINPQFDIAFPFIDGLAFVAVASGERDVKFGYIDKSGNFVWSTVFTKPSPLSTPTPTPTATPVSTPYPTPMSSP